MSITLGHKDAGDGPLITLKAKDRLQHVYVIGQTGTGKSTLIHNMIVQDINAGHGVGFIDPHGDRARQLLDCIPPHRKRDVIYFDPTDYEFPIAINPLAFVERDQRHRVASGIISALQGIWNDVWGQGRMQYIITHTLLALLDYGKASFLGVNQMFMNKAFRDKVIKKIQDPVVAQFWTQEFAAYEKNERFKTEAVAPIQNKVGQFLTTAPLRNVLGQVRSTIDFRHVLDHRQIFIANLSKGKLGEDKADILGSFLVAQFYLAAIQRADVAEAERERFYLFVDEFQSFSTASFAAILSESRKYGLALTLAHQYLDQLNDKAGVKEAVFGNVGSLICFRVGIDDAEVMQKKFDPYSARAIADLDNYTAYTKLLADGQPKDPLLMATLPALEKTYGEGQFLIDYCRQRYGTPRGLVEARHKRWFKRHETLSTS